MADIFNECHFIHSLFYHTSTLFYITLKYPFLIRHSSFQPIFSSLIPVDFYLPKLKQLNPSWRFLQAIRRIRWARYDSDFFIYLNRLSGVAKTEARVSFSWNSVLTKTRVSLYWEGVFLRDQGTFFRYFKTLGWSISTLHFEHIYFRQSNLL